MLSFLSMLSTIFIWNAFTIGTENEERTERHGWDNGKNWKNDGCNVECNCNTDVEDNSRNGAAEDNTCNSGVEYEIEHIAEYKMTHCNINTREKGGFLSNMLRFLPNIFLPAMLPILTLFVILLIKLTL